MSKKIITKLISTFFEFLGAMVGVIAYRYIARKTIEITWSDIIFSLVVLATWKGIHCTILAFYRKARKFHE
jgi:hypothetical protein